MMMIITIIAGMYLLHIVLVSCFIIILMVGGREVRKTLNGIHMGWNVERS